MRLDSRRKHQLFESSTLAFEQAPHTFGTVREELFAAEVRGCPRLTQTAPSFPIRQTSSRRSWPAAGKSGGVRHCSRLASDTGNRPGCSFDTDAPATRRRANHPPARREPPVLVLHPGPKNPFSALRPRLDEG